jgi:hypothetical protein
LQNIPNVRRRDEWNKFMSNVILYFDSLCLRNNFTIAILFDSYFSSKHFATPRYIGPAKNAFDTHRNSPLFLRELDDLTVYENVPF